MNELSYDVRTLVGIQLHTDKVWIIDAVCNNCNKRFKSIRAVSIHIKMTGARHSVNIINYGNYNKKCLTINNFFGILMSSVSIIILNRTFEVHTTS